MKAVLFKSERRFESFKSKLEQYGIETTLLDFDELDWIDFNYADVDIAIYFPEFQFSSNSPQALQKVYDNISYIHSVNPSMRIFPDPKVIQFYSDKYKQYLFLKHNKCFTPETYPILSKNTLKFVAEKLSFPLVVKNRYGAGGDYVNIIKDYKMLDRVYSYSRLNYSSFSAIYSLFKKIFTKKFVWHWLKDKKLEYLFWSYPLIAQKFINHDHDLKTVVCYGDVVEAHWRRRASPDMWKMNIDGGGIGEWSFVPERPLNLSSDLASKLNASWLNIDFLCSDNEYYISEFSPVWHHYYYKEKESFVYDKSYNIKPDLKTALDLEEIIVSSLIRGGTIL